MAASKTLSGRRSKGSKRSLSTGNGSQENESDNNLDERSPKKRGRPSSYHPYSPCGLCSVWVQSGRNATVANNHLSNPMRHPGPEAEAMSAMCQH